MQKPTKLKKIPSFKSDRAAEAFVAKADLSQYDLSGGEFVRFEMKRKDKSISLRLPELLLNDVRSHAKRVGVPYQRFIRMALERAVQPKPTPHQRRETTT
ncbi:MAG TPA: BrnA antitoxin family protein [Rhizomicrobium sp.]